MKLFGFRSQWFERGLFENEKTATSSNDGVVVAHAHLTFVQKRAKDQSSCIFCD
jgi:hypothetical protein